MIVRMLLLLGIDHRRIVCLFCLTDFDHFQNNYLVKDSNWILILWNTIGFCLTIWKLLFCLLLRLNAEDTVIECVKSIFVWKRVQIGEEWALHTQSRRPLLFPEPSFSSRSSLAHACPTCMSFPPWFAGAWLTIQALGCFSNNSLHISLINACEYWWGEPCVPLRPCLRTWSGPRGGREGLRTTQEASLGDLCCVTPPP